MSKLITNSYLRPVYFPVGKVQGQMMYRRAPFDVVVINGDVHIQPRSEGISNEAINLLGLDNLEDRENWRGPDMSGYETLEPIIVSQHQLGDGSDNWIGLHSISNI